MALSSSTTFLQKSRRDSYRFPKKCLSDKRDSKRSTVRSLPPLVSFKSHMSSRHLEEEEAARATRARLLIRSNAAGAGGDADRPSLFKLSVNMQSFPAPPPSCPPPPPNGVATHYTKHRQRDDRRVACASLPEIEIERLEK